MSTPIQRLEECLFISYALEDRPSVRAYVDALAQCRLRTWIDQQEVVSSNSILARISEGIGGSKYAVVFHSAHYAQKVWTREEQAALVYAAILNDERKVWVVMLDDSPLPPLLVHRFHRMRPEPLAFARELRDFVWGEAQANAGDGDSPAGRSEPNLMEWSALNGRSLEIAARQIVHLAPQFLNSQEAEARLEIQLPRLGLLKIEIPIPTEHRELVADLAACLERLDIHSAYIRRLQAQIDQGGVGIFQAGFEIELDRRLQARQAAWEEARSYLQAITASLSHEPNCLPPPRAEGAGPQPAAAKVTILFLGANSSQSPLELEKEVSRIHNNLKLSRERENLVLKQEWAVTMDSLLQALLDESPTIVHFSGHGKESGIILNDERGPREVLAEALSDLFRLFTDTVHCVILNSCYSEHQAHAIRQHIPYVIGMRSRIQDSAAIAFSTGFYKAIGAGRDVPFAFDTGKVRMKMEGFKGETVPILI